MTEMSARESLEAHFIDAATDEENTNCKSETVRPPIITNEAGEIETSTEEASQKPFVAILLENAVAYMDVDHYHAFEDGEDFYPVYEEPTNPGGYQGIRERESVKCQPATVEDPSRKMTCCKVVKIAVLVITLIILIDCVLLAMVYRFHMEQQATTSLESTVPTLKHTVDPLIPYTEQSTTSLESTVPTPRDQCYAEHVTHFTVAIYADGTCYFATHEFGITWFEARDKCSSMNASLASPRTEAQWRAVHDLSRSYSAWIGFRQSPSDGGPWRDMAGNDVTQNVRERLRSDSSGEDCAYAIRVMDWPKFVSDGNCDWTRPGFICEE